jgi:hypothetical protein
MVSPQPQILSQCIRLHTLQLTLTSKSGLADRSTDSGHTAVRAPRAVTTARARQLHIAFVSRGLG